MTSYSNDFPLYTAETSKSYQLVHREDLPSYATRMVAVDPGGADEKKGQHGHVGVAAFGRDDAGDWECVWAGEMNPEEFQDWLSEQMVQGRVDVLVYERWALYPDKAALLVGTEMETSQLIGVIKYIHRMTKGIAARWPAPDVELVVQTAQIKTPTRSLLKSRKLTSMAKFLKVPGDHAQDAELHGYYHILHTLEEPVVQHVVDRLRKRP